VSVANSYTATPGIVPGPLTVNGLLTINNDCGIVLGGSAPKVRLFKGPVGAASMSYNLGCDYATLDSAGVISWALTLDQTNNQALLRRTNTAGTILFEELDRTILVDGASVTNTGNITQNTVKSKVIPANTLGADGHFIIEIDILGNVQGATATNFFVVFGGQTVLSLSRAAVTSLGVRAIIQAANATNVQHGKHIIFDTLSAFTGQLFLGSVDTTVDQTLAILIQSGATTDSWTVQGWKVHALTSRPAPL
jgi:hypothetical protein